MGFFSIEESGDELKADNNGFAIGGTFQSDSILRVGLDIRKGDLTNATIDGISVGGGDASFDEMTVSIGASLDNNIVIGLSRVSTEIEDESLDDTRLSWGLEYQQEDKRTSVSGSLIFGDVKGFALEANSTYFLEPEFGIGFYAKIIKGEIEDTPLDVSDAQIGVRGEYRFSI